VDDASWGALALAISIAAGVWTWSAFRRRGLRSGVRGVGLVLLPPALYLTHTLRLLGRIGSLIGRWAADLVFSPVVWAGVALGAVGLGLIALSTRLHDRDRRADGLGTRKLTPASSRPPDEVEEILRKYGIS
jgi:hypothetical protein